MQETVGGASKSQFIGQAVGFAAEQLFNSLAVEHNDLGLGELLPSLDLEVHGLQLVLDNAQILAIEHLTNGTFGGVAQWDDLFWLPEARVQNQVLVAHRLLHSELVFFQGLFVFLS